MDEQCISKSLLNEVGILENLAKQENFVSNSLENKVGIFSNLAFLASARASLRARIRLRIRRRSTSRALVETSSPLSRAKPASRRLLLGRVFFRGHDRPLPSPRPPPPQQIPTLSLPRPPSQVRSSSSILFFPWPFVRITGVSDPRGGGGE